MSRSRSNSINEPPPTFQAVNEIELDSVRVSKIVSVSVYSGRAEVTRLFKFAVKTGQNQLTILGLPNVLDRESLKVEGRGAATIHDVAIATISDPLLSAPAPTPELTELQATQKRNHQALARTRKSITALEGYLASIRAENISADQLKAAMETYATNAEALDDRVTALEQDIKLTGELIQTEFAKTRRPQNTKLNVKVTIGVFADEEREISIALVYAVTQATWFAGYDIRVDMQTKERAVDLTYKATITQNTGEDWVDVPLTLETTTPTFGVGVPSLTPWTLSVASKPHSAASTIVEHDFGSSMPRAPPLRSMMARKKTKSAEEAYEEEEEYEQEIVRHRESHVSSKGAVSATFGIPGLITVPSYGTGHNVTIARLSLDATMTWVCVPKKDTRVHLKAKIKNASEYTLLAGSASVYVDGSFISKSAVPLVSSDENFDCALGLDPSVRVTYHPLSKKSAQSGLFTTNTVQSFTQRVTVHNSRAAGSGAAGLAVRVVDQVPVSEDATITVKLQQPALVQPGGADGTRSLSGPDTKIALPVKVGAGVVAAWAGSEDGPGQDVDVEALGKDGKLTWTCTVPPQTKVELVLQYEISAPVKTKIAGI
ncbi:hypothetical protein HYPSUDRAFT_48170 [Hypholoma sublateritium FD-334 SS-4]|uniref:Mucoidy inhibitor A n=1 Tax=Hypholoma sublateritium (strain FD-334 SS-4) TaxID=945553 RepID=A0A0D2KM19_HYPSF|nr:hypothetical protein HYPSUDRAFT_48170 [Hypholoma sublateritium FD-334 SS-4]